MSLYFNFVDILIVLVILVSAGYACWRGFLWETLTVFAWIAAAFGCLYFGPYIIPLTRGLVATYWLASIIAYAAVFLAVFIPFAFMSHRFSQTVKNSPIGPLDRAVGVAFGVVRGLILVGLAYLAFTYFVPIVQQPKWVTEARLLPAVQSTSEVLLSLLPHHHDLDASEPRESDHQVVRQLPPNVQAPTQHSQTDDPLADIIRRNGQENRVPHAAREPMPKKPDGQQAKRYGAQDRQALDRLIEAAGNGK